MNLRFTIYDLRVAYAVLLDAVLEQSNVVGCLKAPSRRTLPAQSMTIYWVSKMLQVQSRVVRNILQYGF